MVDNDPGSESKPPVKDDADRVVIISFDSRTAGRYLSPDSDQRRRAVRSQAAKASAALRKATLARKAAAAIKSPNHRQPLQPKSDCSIALNAYQSRIWEEMLNNHALYAAIQLVIITIRGNFAGEQGTLDPHRRSIAWDRMHVANIIRATLATGNNRDVVPAVAVLAGWELRFGDSVAYNTHVKAWKQLRDCNDTSFPNHVEQLPAVLDAVIAAVSKAVRARAAVIIEEFWLDAQRNRNSGGSATTSCKSGLMQTDGVRGHAAVLAPDSLPSGFDVFNPDKLDIIELRGFARIVVNFNVEEKDFVQRLKEAVIPLLVWQPNEQVVGRPSIDRSALYCLRAMMTICVGILTAYSPFRPVDDGDLAEGLRLQIDCITRLNLDNFVGTKYEDMLMWTLTLCLALSQNRDRRLQRLLRGILHNRGIQDCDAFEVILRRFCYREEIVGPKCRGLFEAMMANNSGPTSSTASIPTPAAVPQVSSNSTPRAL